MAVGSFSVSFGATEEFDGALGCGGVRATLPNKGLTPKIAYVTRSRER